MSRAACDRFKQSSDPHRRITGACDGIHGACGNTTVGLACQGSGIGISRFGGTNQDGKVTTREPMQVRASTAGKTFGLNVLSAASLACITVPVPATLPLIGLGLVVFGGLGLRRRSVRSNPSAG